MPRVISHSDVEAVAEGATLTVDADALVTPLALERARSRKVQILRGEAGVPSPTLVGEVTRRVVSRLGDASPQVVEAVIGEVVQALAANPDAQAEHVAPGIDFCAMCIEQERARTRRRAVLTTTGRNTKGIVARVTARIAELGGDILDISQTLVSDYFTMIIVVDTSSLEVPFADFKDRIEVLVRDMGLSSMMMHEDVVQTLHRV